MILAFFDKNGLIYTNTLPRGKTVIGSYMVEALRLFMRRMNQKRPELVKDEWFLHWDNAPVHKAKVVANFVRGRGLKLLEHPPYSPDLAPAVYSFFPVMLHTDEGDLQTGLGRGGGAADQRRLLQGLRQVGASLEQVY